MPDTTIILDQNQLKYDLIQKQFLLWADDQDDIRAVIQVGSRTRTDHLPDEWSDLDLMIYANTPGQYFENIKWLDEIGPVWMAVSSRTAGNDPEILVTFEGGFNVDFVFNPYTQLHEIVKASIIPSGHWRGAKVILDKDAIAQATIPESFTSHLAPLPDFKNFLWNVNAFWYTAFYLAKQLRRGDLVMVKQRDSDLKRCLIQMIEWNARSKKNATDTWHMGRYMQEWADPRAWSAYQQAFSRFDLSDSWKGLITSIELFKWLSEETAQNFNFAYPSAIAKHGFQLVFSLHQGGHLAQSQTD